MKNPKPFHISLGERLVGGVLLVALLPMLLVFALMIHMAAGSPILITDEFPNGRGGITRRMRFRTTGHGTGFFRVLGRFLRAYKIDELPALWNVACGEVSFRELRNG